MNAVLEWLFNAAILCGAGYYLFFRLKGIMKEKIERKKLEKASKGEEKLDVEDMTWKKKN